MTKNLPTYLDLRQLFYFSVVAEERNLHRASERLFISQPPLSRHIQSLEKKLGVRLFIRHTRGLHLTEEGVQVLDIIRPLLAAQASALESLNLLADSFAKISVFGFSTAFEQGVFAAKNLVLQSFYKEKLRIVRGSSPKLIKDILNGKVDAGFVALPLETQGLTVLTLPYSEPLLAVVSSQWAEAQQKQLSLSALSGKPLFWFRREANPAFFDFTRQIFTHTGFMPIIKEEPPEHDVLLAQIAAGEGMGLLPASFAALKREGVRFVPLREADFLEIKLGLAVPEGKEDLLETLQGIFA